MAAGRHAPAPPQGRDQGREKGRGEAIRVDRIACSAHGVCASVAPQLFALDEWGYPIVLKEQVGRERQQAKRAVTLCPARALYLQQR